MEPKDVLYAVGILLTFTVSVYSVYLNRLNRSNGAREYLYKQQFEFYQGLIKRFLEIISLFNRVIANQTDPQEAQVAVNDGLVDIHTYVVQNAFLIPNSLETHIRKAVQQSKDLLEQLVSKGRLEANDNHAISVAYSGLMDYIRNEIGTDKLSDENKRIFNSVITK